MPIVSDRERGTVASSTFATAEILTPIEDENKGIDSGGRVTKVTTTHFTTKTVTTRMAIGNEREISAVMASGGMHVPPLSMIQHIDDNDHPGVMSNAVGRKVSFPEAALSARSSDTPAVTTTTAGATGSSVFSGRILKYGYRLFGNSWHPINLTISRDGVMEWTNTDDHDHSHIVRLKELQPGMVVLGKSCLEIPAFLSPKLNKGTNSDHIIALGKHRNGKVKSYWFVAESEEDFNRLRSVLGQICGYHNINIDGPEVRKIWLGQGNTGVPVTTIDSTTVGAVVPRETSTMVRDVTTSDNGDMQSPRRKLKLAKEAFFESK